MRKLYFIFLLQALSFFMVTTNASSSEIVETFGKIREQAKGIAYTRSIQGNIEAGNVFAEKGLIYIQDLEGVFLPYEEGKWDWGWRGPKGDKEWAWLMNRHRFLLFLADSGRNGMEKSYTQAGAMLRNWIEVNPVPKHWSYGHAWRALEVARRIVGSWAPLLARDDVDAWVDDELKALWIRSLEEHASYLSKHHHFQGNHMITEMNALLVLAYLLGDHPQAKEWRTYALDRLVQQMDQQFFPDGMHRELSNHYHRIALDGLIIAAEVAPETITKHPKWALAWQALVDITMPNGYGPLNNDGDLEYNGAFLEKYKQFAPKKETSTGLYFRAGPSGQFIARRQSETQNWWLLADFGPYGSDHQHLDRLHISWALGERPILVDNGRYHYRNDAWRSYFRGENAHNTLTLAKAQSLQPEWGTEDMENASKDTLSGGDSEWAWASAPKVFKTMLGLVVVYRTVITLADGEVIIVDQRDSLSGGDATTLWNFHPDCELEQEPKTSAWKIRSHDIYAVMRNIYPSDVQAQTLKGQEKPFIAGWHAPNYNIKYPSVQIRATIPAKERAHVWQFSPDPASPAPEVILQLGGKISIHWPQPTEHKSILIDTFGSAPMRYDQE